MNIKNKIDNVGGFVKGAFLLAIGSILAQIIGFVGSILMTHIYSKEVIGIMTIIVAVSNMFAGSINGRFDYAIVKEPKVSNIIPLISLSLLVGFIFSILVSSTSFFYFRTKSEIPSPFIASIFVFIMLLLTAFTNVFRSYNNRLSDYKTMTWVIAIRKLAEEMSMILFGIFANNYIVLLVSRVIGQFFGMKQQTKHVRRNLHEIFYVKWNQIKSVYDIHCKQLYFSTPAAIMNSASYSLITVFIGELFGMSQVAVYSISMSVLGLPLSVISGNLSKVFFGEASKEYGKTGQFKKSIVKTMKILVPLTFVIFIVMYLLMPQIVPLIYGESYIEAGIIIRILAPMFATRFISTSIITGLVVAGYQQIEVVLQSFFLIIAIIIYACGLILEWQMITFLNLISIGYTLVYAIYFVIIWKVSSKT